MQYFEIFVSGAAPLVKTIQANSLADAFERAKKEISEEASYDLCPIWEGEKRVTATFKVDQRKYKLTVFNTAFRKGA